MDRRNKPIELQYTSAVRVKMTRAQLAELERKADASGLSVSEFVRRAVGVSS